VQTWEQQQQQQQRHDAQGKGKTARAHAGEADRKAGQDVAVGRLVRIHFDDGVWYPGTVSRYLAVCYMIL